MYIIAINGSHVRYTSNALRKWRTPAPITSNEENNYSNNDNKLVFSTLLQ